MASIRKRGNRWQAQVRKIGFAPVTRTFSAKHDAALWAAHRERSIDLADTPDTTSSKGMTVADLLTRYQKCVVPQKKGADREAFKIRVLLRHPLAALPVRRLSSKAVTEYRDFRLSVVKPSTVRRELAILRHCFEVARREWAILLPMNPVHLVRLPSPGASRDRRLNIDEMSRFTAGLRSAKTWYFEPLVRLAMETAMRRGELLGLQWSDVDLPRGTALARNTKNGDDRKVPLTPTAIDILGALPRSAESVFPVSKFAVRQSWDRLSKRTGLQNFRFHDLRHEAISHFFEMGLSIAEVTVISGHRDIRMLFRYTHIRPEDVSKKLAWKSVT